MTAPLRAVVTGASGGIGKALALHLARRGARIAGTCRGDAAAQDALAEELRAAGGDPLIRTVDVRRRDQLIALADEVAASWGGIDFWVNNAARLLVKPFLETTEADWEDLLQSNFMALAWDLETWPHLWMWLLGGTSEFPWFGRARMIGLEPNRSWPFDGLTGAISRGQQLTVPRGGSHHSWLTYRLLDDDTPVTGLGRDGILEVVSSGGRPTLDELRME